SLFVEGVSGDGVEGATQSAAGSTYVRKRLGGGFPCSSRGLMLRGSDVENKAPSVALETTRSDSIVNVGDVGIKPAKIAIAFCTTLAQCGHRASFYHFEQIAPGRSAAGGAVGAGGVLAPRLHSRGFRFRICKIAFAPR